MFIVGNYPLTVRILNLFEPDDHKSDESTKKKEVVIKILRTHRRSYIKQITEKAGDASSFVYCKDATGDIQTRKYLIQGGDSLAFPMYYYNDSLEISLDESSGKPDREYQIIVGTKAKCIPENLGEPLDGSFLTSGSESQKDFFIGGAWGITPKDSDPPPPPWKLTITKFKHDPEDEDIIIGADPPE